VFILFSRLGIDVDIDVEHDGLRTKVTPPATTAQPGDPAPPGAQADGATVGPDGAGARCGEGEVDEPNSLGSTHCDVVLSFVLSPEICVLRVIG